MLNSISGIQMPTASNSVTPHRQAESTEANFADMQKRFEQMLWSEMLSQSGLEDALTKSGGQAAAPFARYVVEAIAKDIAETHPLGLSTQAAPIPVKTET